jgi:hypothetical protein
VSENVVLRHAPAIDVLAPKTALGACVSLLGGEPVSPGRLGIILRHSPTVGVHAPKIESEFLRASGHMRRINGPGT